MDNKKIAYIFVSFGASVNIEHVKTGFFHRLLKSKKKPLKAISSDLFKNTEKFISEISRFSDKTCFSFYLHKEDTHRDFYKQISSIDVDEFHLFPLWAQFSYTTIGSVARFFSENLQSSLLDKFFWIKSYGTSSKFIEFYQRNIKKILKRNNLVEKETIFIFLAHGLKKEILYIQEASDCYQKILKVFPYAMGKLYFFPYYSKKVDSPNVSDICKDLKKSKNRKNVILIPISNILEDQKLNNVIENLHPIIKNNNFTPYDLKCLNFDRYWIRSVFDILEEKNFVSNNMLIR